MGREPPVAADLCRQAVRVRGPAAAAAGGPPGRAAGAPAEAGAQPRPQLRRVPGEAAAGEGAQAGWGGGAGQRPRGHQLLFQTKRPRSLDTARGMSLYEVRGRGSSCGPRGGGTGALQPEWEWGQALVGASRVGSTRQDWGDTPPQQSQHSPTPPCWAQVLGGAATGSPSPDSLMTHRRPRPRQQAGRSVAASSCRSAIAPGGAACWWASCAAPTWPPWMPTATRTPLSACECGRVGSGRGAQLRRVTEPSPAQPSHQHPASQRGEEIQVQDQCSEEDAEPRVQ